MFYNFAKIKKCAIWRKKLLQTKKFEHIFIVVEKLVLDECAKLSHTTVTYGFMTKDITRQRNKK